MHLDFVLCKMGTVRPFSRVVVRAEGCEFLSLFPFLSLKSSWFALRKGLGSAHRDTCRQRNELGRGAREGLVTRGWAFKVKWHLWQRGKVAIPGGDTACGDGRGRAWGKISNGRPESLDCTLQVMGSLRVFTGEGGGDRARPVW